MRYLPSVSHLFTQSARLAVLALSITAATQASAAVLAYWRFEGADASSYLADSSGNDRTLSDYGSSAISTVTPPAGFWDYVQEPGVGTFANTQSAGMTSNTTKLAATMTGVSFSSATVEVLVNLTDFSKGTTLVSQGSSMAGGAWGFNVTADPSSLGARNLLFVYHTDATGTAKVTIDSNIQLTASTSYYLAVAYDIAAGNFTFYYQDLDDPESTLQSVTKTVASGTIYGSTLDVNVGGYTSFNTLTGTIDEVRISAGQLASNQLLVGVPEPATMSMIFGVSALLVGLVYRRKRNR
ncbi:MAG: PEP-CTERM sorting domain-containing protein [Verrucomicrobiota bacterium JB024]|nr:PEP-CTERM sorting domain-containing protein [Verrucomicrobiota bacterium JB024]